MSPENLHELNGPLVELVQIGLNTAGGHCLEVDGLAGPFTEAAYSEYCLPQTKPETAPLWVQVAHGERGVSEIPGPDHEQRILDYHAATSSPASSDEVPWCSSFVCFCLEAAGELSTRSKVARSYLKWGVALDSPRYGCIVVLRRGSLAWQGHVGFFVGRRGNSIISVLGGNQSDSVNITEMEMKDVLGYRWIDGDPCID